MNINEILYLIKNSNLKTNTKSFLSAILKGGEESTADADKIKAETDAAYAEREAQKGAKKQLEEDAAYDEFESPHMFKVSPSLVHGKVSRLTPDPDVNRSADNSDIDRLKQKVAQRQEVLATPGRVDPKIAKLETDKATWMQQVADKEEDLSGDLLPFEIEQYPGDPRFSEYALDGIDLGAIEKEASADLKRAVKRQELEDYFDIIANDFRALDQTRRPTGFNPNE